MKKAEQSQGFAVPSFLKTNECLFPLKSMQYPSIKSAISSALASEKVVNTRGCKKNDEAKTHVNELLFLNYVHLLTCHLTNLRSSQHFQTDSSLLFVSLGRSCDEWYSCDWNGSYLMEISHVSNLQWNKWTTPPWVQQDKSL